MSITRWDPWDEMLSLRDAMDQLVRESFVRPRAGMSQSGMGIPVDVRETDDDFVVTATLPGVRPDDVKIQIKGDTLQISGEAKEEYEGPRQVQSGQTGSETQTQAQPSTQEQGGTGSQQGQAQGRRGNWLVRERRYGRFQRSITLPMTVQADQADAQFEHGVLTVTLPKAEESRPRSIPVHAGGGTQQIEASSRTQS